uniref:CWH43-like N-terminal domain-containing protein n=2 Tax=Scylla olivacea TaxID=85551 RepID=A0A0N7ZBC1_SCYOL
MAVTWNVMPLFPLLSALLMPLTFFITYAWSVALGHVEPVFPYISSTGAYPPESNFFSFMLDIISVLMAVTVWARHKQVLGHYNQTLVCKDLEKTSRIATLFGISSAFGLFLVGNFQSSTITTVHLIGAVLAFGLGTVYQWLQSWMSVCLSPRVNSRGVMVVRFICSAMATLLIITTVVFSVLHDMANQGKEVAYWAQNKAWWQAEGRKKWSYHVLATSSEWMLAFTFVAMLLTLVPEFKRMSFHGVKMHYDRDRRQVREIDGARSTEAIVASSSRSQETTAL